jgi:hopene-associated glycosyltransferase HpnB
MAILGAISLAAWLGLLLLPGRPWDLRPRGEEAPPPPDPDEWPAVCVLVPARNEAELLPQTVPSLLAQDYPGRFRVVVVDDRSADGTGDLARRLGAETVAGAQPPAGWAGKVWALEQGLREAGEAAYLLLTDADIRHAPHSLRRLVAESESGALVLNSRMARLRCVASAERLLIPAFAFFFACLYPMRWVASGRRPAAAGGCILLRRDALASFEPIRAAVIDDIALARLARGPARLAWSGGDVVSVRPHDLAGVWRMVSRTAFAQLRYSWAVLALTLAGLALLFVVPPALAATGSLLGGAAWLAMTLAYLPTIRAYRQPWPLAATLPLAGLLYAGMTLDSAFRGRPGSEGLPRGKRPGGGRWPRRPRGRRAERRTRTTT